MAELNVKLPVCWAVLPMTTLPALMRASSALDTPSVSGLPVNTSAPPTFTKVPAVRFCNVTVPEPALIAPASITRLSVVRLIAALLPLWMLPLRPDTNHTPGLKPPAPPVPVTLITPPDDEIPLERLEPLNATPALLIPVVVPPVPVTFTVPVPPLEIRPFWTATP